jgi:16S rRNA (cytosine1402-N4)-methyltransferase
VEAVHTSVLLQEVLDYLDPRHGENLENPFLIDSTLGEGGHSFAFLKAFPQLQVLGLDADAEIQKRAKERLKEFGPRMRFFRGWFNDFYRNYPEELPKPDRILFDLGISIFHYELSEMGFSFNKDERLDMRLNHDEKISAYEIVNESLEEELASILFFNADERYSRRIARAIVTEREKAPIESTIALRDIVYRAVPVAYRRGFTHPATKTFQAIRVAVNHEFDRIKQALEDAFFQLKPGGRMAVISFHSIEDRIVKHTFRDLGKTCVCPPDMPICKCGGSPRAKILTRKPIEPTSEEIEKNAPSRSAKLRVIEKI